MADIVHYYANLPLVEWLAVISSLLYVILAANNNIWCWPAALVSTTLYTVIFYEFYLWSDSLLQVYYFAMAIYGWICWREHTANGNEKPLLAINQKTIGFHIKAILICGVISLLVGWLMANFTPTHFPYLDAVTTIFALFATYLVTQKVVENWLYWIAIDFVSIYLYIEKALIPTAFLFGFFVVFATYGYFKWRRLLNITEEPTNYASSTG
ncbi:nicotinamide riboside transporter PnuC [Thalassotalea piscium]|uniref:Nicotinamide riboside transporter PnuC n=1 Tax=Thalassotalea piscium TaxID=1230533 RepID=A0A7X0TSM8_9GAMM|nr:nicotinamide riboside transporter PnuC [Thalassotalea piscium]MBB6542297.1 nicotinamide mononucleotide transporter [Thalassotalea piscium]